MRCSRRSTRLFVETALAVLLSGAAPSAGIGVEPAAGPIAAAVERAVRERLGAEASVSLSTLSGVRLEAGSTSLVAVLDPAMRVGQPTRVAFADGSGRLRRRVGEATTTIRVVAPVVQAARPIARGARVEAADVTMTAADLQGRPLRRLPSLEDAIGARARHDIETDAVVTHADIAAEPLVRAGDIVRARVRVGSVDVVGEMVAAESGARNDVIRVVNPESRHAARARIVGSREVEVEDVR